MDNARFHRMGKLELLCEELGHKLLPFLPTHLSTILLRKMGSYQKTLQKGITEL